MTTIDNRFTLTSLLTWVLAIFGFGLIVYRFAFGLGAITNLTDGYPWGLWIGIDVLSGIALASGGFIMAGTVHLFGGKKFHSLVRPAVLTAFLGYLLFIFALLVDLGRPWNLWKALISWNHASALFEVSWCVTLYTTVLFLEFLPPVFEKFKLVTLHKLWNSLVPWFIILILGLFTLAMTYSYIWAAVIIVIMLFWEVMMRTGKMPRDKQIPILLVMSGVMFSFLHQSSLGTLYLVIPQKLHALWYSEMLPLMFLLSAIAVGPAMIVIEAFYTKRDKRNWNINLYSELTKAMPILLGIYLIVKIADLVISGELSLLNTTELNSKLWLLEMIVGVILPMILFLPKSFRENPKILHFASVLVVLGLILNRLSVSVFGFSDSAYATYYPSWQEYFITIGVFSMGLIIFKFLMNFLPIESEE